MADLNINVARQVARSAIDRVQVIEVQPDTDHAFSLDTIIELAAMVLNLADRLEAASGVPVVSSDEPQGGNSDE